jgi:hypothetical protein
MADYTTKDPKEEIASETILRDLLTSLGVPPVVRDRFVNRYRERAARGDTPTYQEMQQELWTNYQNVWSQVAGHEKWGKKLTDASVFPTGLLTETERQGVMYATVAAGAVAAGAATGGAAPLTALGAISAGAVGLPTVLGGAGFNVDPKVKREVAQAKGQAPPKAPGVSGSSQGDFTGMVGGPGAPPTWDQTELANLYRLGAGVPQLQQLVQQLTTDPDRPGVEDPQGHLRKLIGWERGTVQNLDVRGTSPALVQQMEASATRSPGVKRLSLKEVMNWPYTLKPDEWRRIQEHLIAAGMVDPDLVRKKQIAYGNPRDAATIGAWVDLIRQSLAQPDKTMWELLEENKATVPEGYLNSLQGKSPIQLTDPAAIRAATRAADERTLGRRGDEGRYIDLVHRSETAEGSQMQAEDGRTVTGVDVDARILEAVRAENPAEAEAHDMASQFSIFQSMLAGPGTSVR